MDIHGFQFYLQPMNIVMALVALLRCSMIIRILTPTLYILGKPHGVVFKSYVCPR